MANNNYSDLDYGNIGEQSTNETDSGEAVYSEPVYTEYINQTDDFDEYENDTDHHNYYFDYDSSNSYRKRARRDLNLKKEIKEHKDQCVNDYKNGDERCICEFMEG